MLLLSIISLAMAILAFYYVLVELPKGEKSNNGNAEVDYSYDNSISKAKVFITGSGVIGLIFAACFIYQYKKSK